jgi:hypothetical protein
VWVARKTFSNKVLCGIYGAREMAIAAREM